MVSKILTSTFGLKSTDSGSSDDQEEAIPLMDLSGKPHTDPRNASSGRRMIRSSSGFKTGCTLPPVGPTPTRSQSFARSIGSLTLHPGSVPYIAALLTESCLSTLRETTSRRNFRFSRMYKYDLAGALSDVDVIEAVKQELEGQLRLLSESVSRWEVGGDPDAEREDEGGSETTHLLSGYRTESSPHVDIMTSQGEADEVSAEASQSAWRDQAMVSRSSTPGVGSDCHRYSDLNSMVSPYYAGHQRVRLSIGVKPRHSEWLCTGFVLPKKYSLTCHEEEGLDADGCGWQNDDDGEEWGEGDDCGGGGLAGI